MNKPGLPITLRGITKAWPGAVALDDVNLTMPAGQFSAILGPSGCGKSTLLRMIAGLETPSHGKIFIDDRDVTALPADQRGLSFVFQSYALFPHLSVAENIVFGLRTRRVARAERSQRLAEVAQLLGLGPYLDRKPAQLSGGQQQRVALGRAIIAKRAICLMDEPLSNLDAKLRQTMRGELRALQRQLGFTMVYVTHDQVEAITMADQVVLMNAGRVEQVAAPDVLYLKPQTVFAARFIGTPAMNILPAAALGALGQGLEQAAGRALAVGLRPEALVQLPQSPVVLSCTHAEYLGADALAHGHIGGHPVVMRAAGADMPRPGAQLPLGFAPQDLHLFDFATEHRTEVAGLSGIFLRAGMPTAKPTGAVASPFKPKDD